MVAAASRRVRMGLAKNRTDPFDIDGGHRDSIGRENVRWRTIRGREGEKENGASPSFVDRAEAVGDAPSIPLLFETVSKRRNAGAALGG